MYRKILIPFHFKASMRPPLLQTIKTLVHDETADITLLRLTTSPSDYQPEVTEQLYTELRGVFAGLQTEVATIHFDTLREANNDSVRNYAEQHGFDFIMMHNYTKLDSAELGQVWRTLPGLTIIRCQPQAALISHPPTQIAIAAS